MDFVLMPSRTFMTRKHELRESARNASIPPQLRAHIDAKFPNRNAAFGGEPMAEDAAAYFGNGDESHMNFTFPSCRACFMALQMEDRFPIIDILEQTPSIPEQCQWAMFFATMTS